MQNVRDQKLAVEEAAPAVQTRYVKRTHQDHVMRNSNVNVSQDSKEMEKDAIVVSIQIRLNQSEVKTPSHQLHLSNLKSGTYSRVPNKRGGGVVRMIGGLG